MDLSALHDFVFQALLWKQMNHREHKSQSISIKRRPEKSNLSDVEARELDLFSQLNEIKALFQCANIQKWQIQKKHILLNYLDFQLILESRKHVVPLNFSNSDSQRCNLQNIKS